MAMAGAVLFGASMLSQAPTAPVPEQISGPYWIAGRVVNAVTGEPVRRATVAALAEEDSHIVRSVASDNDGRFSLENLPAGKYPLTASRRGFRTAFYDEHDDYNSAIVTGPDQDTSHLAFRLTPGAVLYGVVTGDGGDPAENASVILFKRERGTAHAASENSGQSAGNGEIRQSEGGTTDDTGAFEFTNLAAGEYYISVVTSPWYAMHPPPGRSALNEDSPLDVAYPVTFFDSTTQEASASPIMLEAGGRQEANIALHAEPALRLQVAAPRKGPGFVQPELRTMVFGVQVSAETAGGFDPVPTGLVEFRGVPPGHYELVQGDPTRISEIDATSSQVVDPNAGALAATVSGVLRTTNGAPLPDNVNVSLEPANGPNQAMGINAHKGAFRFDAVPPGTWNVSAFVQGNALPVVAVAADGPALAGNQITVKGRPVAAFVTVSPSLSRVKGFARANGKGAAGAMIVLVPRQPSAYSALVRRDQSDSDGSFSLRDVPAGQYTVVAIEDGWKLDWTDRQTIARYLPRGVAITVSGQAGADVALSEPVLVQPK